MNKLVPFRSKGPLFRTMGRTTGLLTSTSLPEQNAHAMIRRRAAGADITTQVGNHTFQTTDITAYLKMAARSKTPRLWRTTPRPARSSTIAGAAS